MWTGVTEAVAANSIMVKENKLGNFKWLTMSGEPISRRTFWPYQEKWLVYNVIVRLHQSTFQCLHNAVAPPRTPPSSPFSQSFWSPTFFLLSKTLPGTDWHKPSAQLNQIACALGAPKIRFSCTVYPNDLCTYMCYSYIFRVVTAHTFHIHFTPMRIESAGTDFNMKFVVPVFVYYVPNRQRCWMNVAEAHRWLSLRIESFQLCFAAWHLAQPNSPAAHILPMGKRARTHRPLPRCWLSE